MSPMRTIWLVAARELRERGMTRGYVIGTAITALALVAGIVLPVLLGGDGDTRTLGVVGDAPADLEQQLAGALPDDLELTVTSLPDRDAAEEAIADGTVDQALVDRSELLTDGPPGGVLTSALDQVLQLDAVASSLADAGLDPDQAEAALTAQPPLQTVDLGDDADRPTDDGSFLIGLGITVLLFLGIQLNGNSVLSGSLEEKSSRVVEVLVSAARPWQLLSGKLFGMTVLALTQIAVIVGSGLAANAAVDAFPVPGAAAVLLVFSLVMLVVGFLFYASLYAVAGSLASSLEDAQSSAGPLGFLIAGAYFAAVFVAVPAPTSTWAQILSYVPPTAPFIVPARLGLGAMSTLEALVSVVITAITAALTVRLAGRLYASSLLAGGKLTWRDAWRAEPVR